METESKLAELDARQRISEHRIRDLETEMKDLRELTKAVSVTGANIEHLQEEVGEMRGDLRRLTALPAKRWESVIAAIITGCVGTAIGALLANLL